MKRNLAKTAFVLVLCGSLLAGCTGQTNTEAEPTASPSPTAEPVVTIAPGPSAPEEATAPPQESPASAATPAPTVDSEEYTDLSFLTEEQQKLYTFAVDNGYGLFGMGSSLMYAMGYEQYRDTSTGNTINVLGGSYELYKADYDEFLERVHKVFTDNCLALTDFAAKFKECEGEVAVHATMSDDMVEGTTKQVNEAYPDTYRPVSCSENQVEFLLISHYDRNGWNDVDDPMDVYTIEYPIRMIKTADGWRLDEFHLTMFG